MVCGIALALGGCYRSATIELDEVRRIDPDPDGVGARIAYRDGDVRRYADHDLVEVRARTERSEHTESFERPLRVRLDERALFVTGRDATRSYRRLEVDEIALYEHAPERPWIILGWTVAGAVVGGFAGYHSAGKCNPDAEWGCMANGINAMAGSAAGFAIALPLSIVLSGQLRPESEPPRPRAAR
jgi:hypothetical protein